MTHHQDIQDINAERSTKAGASGSLESFLRRFRQLAYPVSYTHLTLPTKA